MKKNYFLFTIFLTVVFLTACSNDSSDSKEITSFDTTLNCEQAGRAMLMLTGETVAAFSGGEEVNTYTDGFIDWCSSHPDLTLFDCEAFSDTEFEYCVKSVGVLGKFPCLDSFQCKTAFAASHIADCGIFENQKDGPNGVPLEHVCLFSLAYISRERDACDQIVQLSFDDPLCEEEENLGKCYLNRYKCLWGVSDQTNDVNICDSMDPSFERSLCYFSYSVKNSKPEYCEKIDGGSVFGERISSKLCLKMVGKPIDEELVENGGVLGAPMKTIEKLLAK